MKTSNDSLLELGLLELLPFHALLVQILPVSGSSKQEVICEKLLGRRAAAKQRQTMHGSTLNTPKWERRLVPAP